MHRPADDKTDLTVEDITVTNPTAGVRALNRGIREAARWYQFCGLQMVTADAEGNPVEIDPAEVLARLDAADCE